MYTRPKIVMFRGQRVQIKQTILEVGDEVTQDTKTGPGARTLTVERPKKHQARSKYSPGCGKK